AIQCRDFRSGIRARARHQSHQAGSRVGNRRERHSMNNNFSAINLSKANFDEIYIQDDPRGYFSVLGALDYMIPDLAEPVIRQILAALLRRHETQPTVLDVGCSYGINAAVHRFPLGFSALRNRYARHEMTALSSAQLASLDRKFYESWPEVGTARFLGLDISAPAIRYAKHVGLIEDGVIADLEEAPLSPADAAIISRANVILSTGAVGYVTEKTYRKLLDAMPNPPWVISFVLRMFPFDKLAQTLEEYGLVTEK